MDQEAVVACFEPDVKAHFHPSRPPEVGHHALRLAFQTMSSVFQSVAPIEVRRMDSGGVVAVQWVSRGVPLEDGPRDVAGVLILKRARSGRIRAFWNHFIPA